MAVLAARKARKMRERIAAAFVWGGVLFSALFKHK